MSWLIHTLVWTGALIALVLLVRRPVARHFGARAAYALWALPLMRLALPPVVLPASFDPRPEPAMPLAGAIELDAAVVAPSPAVEAGFALADLWPALFAVWLVGAAGYVGLRLTAYRRLRGELLAEARPVGSAAGVRLIETPATRSPLAFGVLDKVVALPPGFMAQPDRAARDLALAHELAHHRAHDLLVNFAMLPLFALHWFNPLSRLGWIAMRRDQEAACDARVVEGRGRPERAQYAAVIADAVTAPRFALAAPMACPVLGDPSIIDRLRNLAMTDHSPRRRRAGKLLVALGALALPLTGSFSYAQSGPADAPEPPALYASTSAPPAPDVPDGPPAATPTAAPDAQLDRPPASALPRGAERRVIVIRDRAGGHPSADGAKVIERKYVIRGEGDAPDHHPDDPAFSERMRAHEERQARMAADLERRAAIDEKRLARMTADALAIAERAARSAPVLVEDCTGPHGVSESRSEDGRRIVRMCRSRISGPALSGLRSARAAIARNDHMSAEIRAEVLAALDSEIARLEAEH